MERYRATAKLAALVLVGSLASGCVLTTAVLVPSRSRVEIIEETHTVEVRSVPDGATVRTATGATVTAPGHVKVPYRIERKARTPRIAPIVIAGVIALGLFMVVGFQTDFGRDSTAGAVLFYASATDLLSACLIGPGYAARNFNWRSFAKERPLVVDEPLTFVWPGFAPARANVVVPTQPYLTVRRASLGTFDEALLRWDRTANMVPPTKGLLELAGAYDRLVEQTKQVEHAARAVQFYDQYRSASDADPVKVELARTRVEALRSEYRIGP